MSALLQFDATALATVKSASGPKWNKLFPSDTTRFRSDFPGGRIDFTPEFLASMVANWQRVGSPGLPVDYSHDEKGLASGWIEALDLRDDGLYAAIRWTDAARDAIQADELRYLSPTFAVDGDDSSTGASQGPTLYGAALLNTPFLQDLPRVAASAFPNPRPATHNASQKGNPMDPTQLAKSICKMLGLPDGTDNETMLSALTKCFAPSANAVPPAGPQAVKTGNPNVGDVPTKNGPADTAPTSPVTPTGLDPLLPGGDNEPVGGMPESKVIKHPVTMSAEALKTSLARKDEEVRTLMARVGALETERFAEHTQRLSEKLIREGRILSKQTDAVVKMARTVGFAETEAFFGALPVVVKMGAVGTDDASDALIDIETTRKAYWAEVDAAKAKYGLKLSDATRRVNATHPELAAAITLTNKAKSA